MKNTNKTRKIILKTFFIDKPRKKVLFLGAEEKTKDNKESLNKQQEVPCKLSRREGGEKEERVSNILN
jgi:hypothetical protein